MVHRQHLEQGSLKTVFHRKSENGLFITLRKQQQNTDTDIYRTQYIFPK